MMLERPEILNDPTNITDVTKPGESSFRYYCIKSNVDLIYQAATRSTMLCVSNCQPYALKWKILLQMGGRF